MAKRYTEGYIIISDGSDYYIAEAENKRLDGPNIVAKLNTEKRYGSSLVERNGSYYPSAIEVGDLVIHLRAETDNNMVSISGADPVKMSWDTTRALIDAQERKADFDERKAHEAAKAEKKGYEGMHHGGFITNVNFDSSHITANAQDVAHTVERALEKRTKRTSGK